jgi:hypothetical protein
MQRLRSILSNELNRTVVSAFRNVVFPSILESRTVDKVPELSDSECYALSFEPFGFQVKAQGWKCVDMDA